MKICGSAPETGFLPMCACAERETDGIFESCWAQCGKAFQLFHTGPSRIFIELTGGIASVLRFALFQIPEFANFF